MWNNLKPAYRFPLLITGMLSLVLGIFSGLGRLGTPVPEIALDQMAYHSVLMIPAFFGTVIGLERAVAIGQRWAYLAPLLTGIGGITLSIANTPDTALMLLLIGSIVFTLACIKVLIIQQAAHNWILLIAATCLITGNSILLSGFSINDVIYWWICYLLLTIAGERLELSRLVIQNDNKRNVFLSLTILPVIGTLTTTYIDMTSGILIFSLGMSSIAVWLLKYDIARRTLHLTGLTRFTAICMLTAYVWLFISAILLTGITNDWLIFSRDATLHSFFLGFVFTMVIGHALIIFPAVTELKIPYSHILFIPFLVLQLSLLVRVVSDLINNTLLLQYSGIANAIALALFIFSLLWLIARGLSPKKRSFLNSKIKA